MSKQSSTRKQTVELAPSRIRRDPVRQEKKVEPRSREDETWLAVAGVVLFGVLIAVLTVSFSALTAQDDSAVPAAAQVQQRFGACDGSADCVMDGETIRISGATVKIAGMAAPHIADARCDEEKEQGAKAAEKLTQLLNGGNVTAGAAVTELDGEQRTRILVGGRDVAGAMIAAGVAREPQDHRLNWCSE